MGLTIGPIFSTESHTKVNDKYDKLICESLVKETLGIDNFNVLSEGGQLDELRDIGILSENVFIDESPESITRSKRLSIFALAEEYKDEDFTELVQATAFANSKLKVLCERYSEKADDRISRYLYEMKKSKTVVGNKVSKK